MKTALSEMRELIHVCVSVTADASRVVFLTAVTAAAGGKQTLRDAGNTAAAFTSLENSSPKIHIVYVTQRHVSEVTSCKCEVCR